jgi:glycosyltransferase involved in cell wall biosynthesis
MTKTSTSSPTLYYDITQLAHWSGKITGIPRVIDELAKRFYSDSELKVEFVSWVKERGELCLIDFEQTILERRGVVYATHNNSSRPTPASPTHKYRRLAKKVVKKGFAVSAKVSPQLAGRLEARVQHLATMQYQPAQFESGDILFIPWGEWWDQNFTNYVVGCHKNRGVKVVQIIHDIGPTSQPHLFERVAVKPTVYNSQVLPIASLVLTNSQNSKRELIEWLQAEHLHVPPITVFRLGDSLEVAKPRPPADPAFSAAKFKGNDYILSVGTFEAKKNHHLLYYVYKLALARNIELPPVVIVGRRGWQTDMTYDFMTEDPAIKGKFIFLFNAGDEELSWLYDHCLFSVLASFHEGWGIPVAESLARGVPCLCSNTSSMVEIAEDQVDHFSPFSTDECLAGIQKMLQPAYLKQARAKAKTYRSHDWDQAYRQAKTAVITSTKAGEV